MEPVILANSKFSIDLLKLLCKKTTGNVFFSPLSISSALGLVALGAKGNTKDQMYKTLHFGNMIILYHDLYEELYKGGKNRSLVLVNRMFGEKTVNFYDNYLDNCEEWCFASLRNLDFKTDPEAAREYINNWVKTKTGDQIESLLDQGDVTKDTTLALVSAVHFKDKWDTAFKPCDSKKNNAQYTFMCQTNTLNLGYIPEAECQILELPYQNKDLSMIIMLPHLNGGLQKLEKLITYENIFKWTEPDNMIATDVYVEMPVFKMLENYDLEQILKDLGTTDLFGDKCDLSLIAPGPLKLCKVVHKCSLEVGMEGTQADAGSQGLLKSRNDKDTQCFVVQQPFIFFIRHNSTKSILFWGRYSFTN